MPQHDSFSPDDLEQVFASIDPTEVRMARDCVDQGGIESFIFDSASSRMLGTTVAVPSRLMVHAEDAGEARQRLRDMGFAEK